MILEIFMLGLITKISDYCLNQYNPQILKEGLIIIKELTNYDFYSSFDVASFEAWVLNSDLDKDLRTFVLNNL